MSLDLFDREAASTFAATTDSLMNETRFQKRIVCYDDTGTDQLHIQPRRCRSWHRRREIEELEVASDIGSVGSSEMPPDATNL
jgi:hypothetical protein